MTREQIEKEVARLTAGRSAPPHARASLLAFMQARNGLDIDQTCPYCEGDLRVEDRGSAWFVRCPCGRTDNAFRGL